MILKPQNFMFLISTAVLFTFFAAEASGMRTIDLSDRVKFHFSKTDTKFDKLQSFLKAADSATYSISGLKATDKTAQCSVIVTNNDLKGGFEINTSRELLRIFLSDDLSEWEKNYKTHSAVISAMLLNRFGIRPDENYSRVPDWIIAGILSKIEIRRNPAMLSRVRVYPGLSGLAAEGIQPDLWCILNNPLEYRDGPSFALYSESCAIIIDSIARIPKNKDIMMAILKSAIAGEKPETAFKTAINDYIMKSGFDFSTLPADQISPEKKVEAWFGTVIRNSSVNIFFPGSSDFVEKRLDELKTLNYEVAVAPENDKPAKSEQASRPDEQANSRKNELTKKRSGEVKSCESYELGKKWNEIENPERIANIYGRYFSDLSNQSPSLIQNEVNKIAEIFCRLKDGDKETFERDFKDAENKLREKIVKLRQVEDYIRECEAKFVPFSKKYSAELKYLETSGTFISQFCPSLNSFLDKEEKGF